MNDFHSKAKQVRKEGALLRGEFNPKGAPREVYKFWKKHAQHVPDTENFCHFWRVVVFWAPLTALRLGIIKAFSHKTVCIAAVITYVLGFLALAAFVNVGWIAFVAVPYFLLGVSAAILVYEGNSIPTTDQERQEDRYINLLYAATAPVSFTVTAMAWLVEKPTEYFRSLNWKAKDIIARVVLGIVLTTAGIGLSVILFLSFKKDWIGTLSFIGLLFGMFLAGTVITVVISLCLNKQTNHKAQKRQAHWRALQDGIETDVIITPPGKFKAFLTGVKDFATLLVQIVRVKKWKICPIVNIDE
jgi:hypothetical protein